MLFLGLLFGVVSSVLSSFGYVFQRKGRLQALETGNTYLKNCNWIFGQFIAILRTPIYMVALSLTSQTTLSIVPIFSIYMIILASRLILHNELTWNDFFSTWFFTPGMVLIIIGSHVKQPDIKSTQLGDYVFSTGSIWLLIGAFVSLVFIGIFVYRIINSFEIVQQRIQTLNFSERGTFENSETHTEMSADPIIPPAKILSYRWGLLPMVYFPFLAALFGTLSNTVAKCLIIVYHDDIHHHVHGSEGFGVAYCVLLGALNVVFMVLNLFFLNKWFRYFEPIHIIPLERTSNLICNLLCGGIVYKEFQYYNFYRTAAIFVGCGLCIVGAMIFMTKKDQDLKEKDFIRDEILSQASFGSCHCSEASVKALVTLK